MKTDQTLKSGAKMPVLSDEQIRLKAEQVAKKHSALVPPIDPEMIAEQEGVDVVYAQFSGDMSNRMHGFYDTEDNRIYVNADDSVEEKVYTIAHELGHVVLHRDYLKSPTYMPRIKGGDDTIQEEREADAFAIHLLAPSDLVKKFSKVASITEVARMFIVTEQTILAAKNK